MHKLRYVTHRPYGPMQKRILNSLNKSFDIKFVTPSFTSQSAPLVSLKKDLWTAIRLLSLGTKALFQHNNILLDYMDCIFYPYELKHNKLIVEASTPLHIEMQWLGYPNYIINLVKKREQGVIQKSNLIFTPNELMEKYYRSSGAGRIIVVPNYPFRAFRKEYTGEETKAKFHLSSDSKLALFVGGGHMREIYGFDLLLESWKIVEKNVKNSYLLIVGPTPASLEQQVESLSLKNVIACGIVNSDRLSRLIYDATVCLAPRTSGFPTEWYNDKDSTKISEYAAYSKPIVACGYNKSTQYHLTNQTPEDFANGIIKGLEGNTERSLAHFWEDNVDLLINTIDEVLN